MAYHDIVVIKKNLAVLVEKRGRIHGDEAFFVSILYYIHIFMILMKTFPLAQGFKVCDKDHSL